MSAAILLCSGGLDSTTVAYWLIEQNIEILPIFFDYGQHCVEKEWQTLHDVLPVFTRNRIERIDISGIFRGSKSRLIVEPDLWIEHVNNNDLYVPYRTMLLLSAGAACAQTRGVDTVCSGFINSNHAKEIDCSTSFLNGLDKLAEDVGPVKFKLPFRNWSKAQVTQEALRLNVPIGATFSCQLLSDTPCGACPNCVERLDAISTVESFGNALNTINLESSDLQARDQVNIPHKDG